MAWDLEGLKSSTPPPPFAALFAPNGRVVVFLTNGGENNVNSVRKLGAESIITSSGLMTTDLVSRGVADGNFLFHTKPHFLPFVIFEVSERLVRAEALEIVNRLNAKEMLGRAFGLVVSLSSDLSDWNTVPVFPSNSLDKFIVPLHKNFRFIKISLSHPGVLHLSALTLRGVSDPLMDESSKYFPANFGFYANNNGVLEHYATHNAGFFSILSTILRSLCATEVPVKRINSILSFFAFKDKELEDPFHQWFEVPDPNKFHALFTPGPGPFAKTLHHHDRYENLQIERVSPYIDCYFSPTSHLKKKIDEIINQYKIVPEKTVVVCYRGTDKHVEVAPVDIGQYMDAADLLLKQNPGFRLLVQTDQQQIKEQLLDVFSSLAFAIDEMPTTSSDQVIHKMIRSDRFEFATTLLAVVYIISKCKFIITHTGNVAYWSSLFRGHTDGLIQF